MMRGREIWGKGGGHRVGRERVPDPKTRRKKEVRAGRRKKVAMMGLRRENLRGAELTGDGWMSETGQCLIKGSLVVRVQKRPEGGGGVMEKNQGIERAGGGV